jgi:glucose/arabinose dehydrogenase
MQRPMQKIPMKVALKATLALAIAVSASVIAFTTTFSQTVALQSFAAGLSDPIFLTAPQGDSSRVYIVEQSGAIQLYKDGVFFGTFLDISSKIAFGGEQGLLGMAFHPDFPATPFFYVNYTAAGGGQTVVARYGISGGPDLADAASEAIILTQTQPEFNHNGGMIAFGPNDGYLYIGFGDGGGFNDLHGLIGNGQNPTTWLGKMLRIDVDGGFPYVVPGDNPFVGVVDTLPEIWSLGLRNPWRFSFDDLTGDMYIGDVGQGLWEEIDFEPAASPGGINWGWRLREGANCFIPTVNCDPGGITTDPIHEYTHNVGRCSVTGGYVYRGCAIPELDGVYFYADFCTGEIWSFDYSTGVVLDFQLRFNASLVSSFGTDGLGEMYVVQLGGQVLKIVPLGAPATCGAGCCVVAGDANHDGSFNISDVTFAIARIFSGGPAPVCQDEIDANGDNSFNISDVTYMIARIFSGGPAPVCGTTGA